MRTAVIVSLVFFFVACRVVAQIAEGRVTADQNPLVQDQNSGSETDLLVENAFQYSHTIGVQLSPTDQIELLVRLAGAAGKKHPEQATRWAIEALQLANSTVQRAQYESKAIRALASVNSEQALALLPNLEPPASSKDSEELARAARSVFQEFLKQHPSDWEKLSLVAQRMGDKGNYPFQAIHVILRQAGSKDPEVASALMQQAIHYYNLSAHSPFSNHQLALLLTEDSGFVPASILKATLEAMLSSLLEADHAPPEKITEDGPTGNALNRATLALLLPLIGSVDPEMERKLRREHPALDSPLPSPASARNAVADLEAEPTIVAATLPPAGSVSVILPDKSAQTPPARAHPVERPNEADSARIVLTPSPDDVARSLHDSEEALNNVRDPEQRLQILVERGVSLVSSERWAELSSVLADAFALGEKLFRKSVDEDPQASWNSRPGARALSTLVEAAAKTAPQMVLQRVRNVNTSVLRAQLYVSFVEGVQSEEGSPSVIVTRAGN